MKNSDVKVEQATQPHTGQTQIRQQLNFVHRKDVLYGFYLDDDLILNPEIQAVLVD